MITLLVLIPAVIFIAIILIIAGRNRRVLPAAEGRDSAVAFRWRYIAAPSIVFLISVILVAGFYSRLPADVSWHFGIDGTPDRWLARNSFVAITLVIQFILVLAGFIVVLAASAGMKQSKESIIKPESMLAFMGNVPAVIQIIIGFVMVDCFSYNVFQKHLMPLWLFLIIILVLATIALIIFFIVIALKMGRQNEES